MNNRNLIDDFSAAIVALIFLVFTRGLGAFIGYDLADVIAFAPLLGTLLRFRINYEPRPSRSTETTPKDLENATEPRAGKSSNGNEGLEGAVEPVRGYLHMLRKTLQTEVRVCLKRPLFL